MNYIKKMDMKTTPSAREPFWKKLSWLAIIYGGSVLALLVVAVFFHVLMFAAGMRSH